MSHRAIYLDNAATSFPKPPGVLAAVQEALEGLAGSADRSFGEAGLRAERTIYGARQSVAELLGAKDPSTIVFTANATEALNLALLGTLVPGDHVVTTNLEHNSVARPLRYLEQTRGITITRVPGPGPGLAPPPSAFAPALRRPTKLVVVTHASNVTGAILAVGDITALAHERGARALVDASQTAGAVPINVEQLGVDMLAFTGHKALLGPQGTGGLYIAPDIEPDPLLRGGTGSRSFSDTQPDLRPDRYESGTPNTPGLAGLGAAVEFLLDRGIANVRAHEVSLISNLLAGLRAIGGVESCGPPQAEERVGLVSFNVGDLDPADVGQRLASQYGIITRVGLHCAPWTHAELGTLQRGAVRASVSVFTTNDDIAALLTAAAEIAAKA